MKILVTPTSLQPGKNDRMLDVLREFSEDLLFNPTGRPLTAEELKEWHEKSGLPLKRFFNTSGMIYRQEGLKDKIPHMTEAEQYELLSTNGMLVKRPLIIGENFVLTGFKEDEWAEVLL